MWVSRAEGRGRSRAVGSWAGLDEGSAGSACHKHHGGDGTSHRAQIRARLVSLRGQGSAVSPPPTDGQLSLPPLTLRCLCPYSDGGGVCRAAEPVGCLSFHRWVLCVIQMGAPLHL